MSGAFGSTLAKQQGIEGNTGHDRSGVQLIFTVPRSRDKLMTDPIRLLIVDDQRLMREGLRTLLEFEQGFEIVGEAANGQAAIDAYASLRPDVVLMDIRMPGMDGVEATRRLCESWPENKGDRLTTFDDDANVFEGLRAGAVGYLLKDLSGQELANAVRTVYNGGGLIEPAIAKRVMAEFPRTPFLRSGRSAKPCPNPLMNGSWLSSNLSLRVSAIATLARTLVYPKAR